MNLNQELRSYSFVDDDLWFALEDVLRALELTEQDTLILREDEPEDFKTLIDGTEIISEGGFYYLTLFVSKTPEAKKFANWVMNDVIKSIAEKGYYKKG